MDQWLKTIFEFKQENIEFYHNNQVCRSYALGNKAAMTYTRIKPVEYAQISSAKQCGKW